MSYGPPGAGAGGDSPVGRCTTRRARKRAKWVGYGITLGLGAVAAVLAWLGVPAWCWWAVLLVGNLGGSLVRAVMLRRWAAAQTAPVFRRNNGQQN